jgi:hypothetical protein
LLSIILAWLTYQFIEKPIRFHKYSKTKALILLAIGFLVGSVGYAGYNGYIIPTRDSYKFDNYFDNSYPEMKFATRHNIFKDYRMDCDFYNSLAHRYNKFINYPIVKINKSCYTKDHSKSKHVLIWGDSHAQQLYYGLNKNLPKNWQILQVASSSCFPEIIDQDSNDNFCIKSNFVALEAIKVNKPDVVIIAQLNQYNVNKSLVINDKLKQLGISKVIFIGPVPRWKSDLPKIISRKLWKDTPQRSFVGIDQKILAINQQLKSEFASKNLNYLDAIAVFCNDQGCLTRIGDDRLTGIVSSDYGHLLQISSDYLAKNLLVEEVIAP